MVTRRASDNALQPVLFRELGNAVVRATQFEGKHGLQVLALEQDVGTRLGIEIDGRSQRRFFTDVVHS